MRQLIKDRRCAARITIALPVTLEPGTGTTRDVSQEGVFFFTARKIEVGTPLDFALEFDYLTPGEAVLLRYRGEVVR
ncbi:MAG: PilZ domain-containing protein, partial [Desulfuromonadales bacterium]|nr:PilZ domain-containing protein [Desulfuromonadales bacterium]